MRRFVRPPLPDFVMVQVWFEGLTGRRRASGVSVQRAARLFRFDHRAYSRCRVEAILTCELLSALLAMPFAAHVQNAACDEPRMVLLARHGQPVLSPRRSCCFQPSSRSCCEAQRYLLAHCFPAT